MKNLKYSKFLALIVLVSVLLLAAVNLNIPSVKAQTTESVYVYTSCGGTISANGASLTGDIPTIILAVPLLPSQQPPLAAANSCTGSMRQSQQPVLPLITRSYSLFPQSQAQYRLCSFQP